MLETENSQKWRTRLTKVIMSLYPEVKGINLRCIGGENYDIEHGSGFSLAILHKDMPAGPAGGAAHCHLDSTDPFYHHMCICHPAYFIPEIFAHEYAHILDDTEDHGPVWIKRMNELGVRSDLYVTISTDDIKHEGLTYIKTYTNYYDLK